MIWSAFASLAYMLFLLALGAGDPVEDKEPAPIPSVVQSVQWSPDESKFIILDHFGSYTIWTVQGRNFRLGYMHIGSSMVVGSKSKLSSSVEKSSRILRLTWWSDTKLALVRGNDSLSVVNSSLQAVGGDPAGGVIVSTTGLSKDSPSSEAANLLFAPCQLAGVVALASGTNFRSVPADR